MTNDNTTAEAAAKLAAARARLRGDLAAANRHHDNPIVFASDLRLVLDALDQQQQVEPDDPPPPYVLPENTYPH